MAARPPGSQRRLAFYFAMFIVVLALLYAWTLTEEATFTVRVSEGVCTAVVAERSSAIPCPDLDDGRIGIYLEQPAPLTIFRQEPLESIVPSSTLRGGIRDAADRETQRDMPEDSAGGQLYEIAGRRGITTWPTPRTKAYEIFASLRRPDNALAGILLLRADSDGGWLFQIDSDNRQGVWKYWDGGAAGIIRGVPYQKPLATQAKSYLRLLLVSAAAALLITALVSATMRLLNRLDSVLALSNRIGPGRNGEFSSRPFSPMMAAALCVLLASFGATMFIASSVLERVPHVQDSITFLFQAQIMARGSLWAPPPPIPEAFEQEFLFILGDKWIGQYPPGYPLVLVVGVLAGAPWLVNPWLGTLAVALLYQLGATLYKSSTGILAAGLALLSPFFIFLTGSLMVHTAELLWVSLLMVAWALALRSPFGMRWAVFAGLATGMLLITRQITAVILIASYVLPLWVITGWEEKKRRHLLQQAGIWLMAALPFLLLLLGYQRGLTGSPWDDPRLIARPFDRPGFGPEKGELANAFVLEDFAEGMAVNWYVDPQQPPRGHTLARGLYNSEKNWSALAEQLFGWPAFFTLSFCWLPFLLGPRYRVDWVLLGIVTVVILTYTAYWSTGLMYGPRYYYAAMPSLLLLTARGLQTLSHRYSRGATAIIFLGLTSLALLLYWPQSLRELADYNYIGGDEQAVVESQIAEEALVFVPVKEWWDYGRFFSGNTPWLDSRIIYARDLGPEMNNCLQRLYPKRKAYLWQWSSGGLEPLTVSPQTCPR